MATLGSIPENYNIQEGRIAIAIIISNEPSAATTTVSYDDRWQYSQGQCMNFFFNTDKNS